MRKAPSSLATGHHQGLVLRRMLGLSLLFLASATPASAVAFAVFVHETDSGNTFLHATAIDHPSLNDRPDAEFWVMPVFNPGGALNGVLNPEYVGVSYGSSGRWSIENQSLAAMPLGMKFFVLVAPFSMTAVHEATVDNTAGSVTTMDSPTINGADASLFGFTYVRNLGGGSGPRNDHPLALQWAPGLDRWQLVNQDGGAMALGAFFLEGAFDSSSRFAAPSIRMTSHTTTPGNTTGDLTRLENPALEGAPYNAVFAFPVVDGAVNPHPIAVAYDFFQQRWSILNQDQENLPLGMTFHVAYVPVLFANGFESGTLVGWSSSVP